jgi:PAS domain S-box-containing protein
VFAQFTAVNPAFTNLALVDPSGATVCSAIPLWRPVPNQAGSPWFRALADGATTSVSAPMLGPLSQRWLVLLARAVRSSDGRLRGALVVSLDIDHYTRILSRIAVPPGSAVQIVDQDLRVLARIPGTSLRGSSVAPTPLGRLIASRAEGYGVARGRDGVDRIQGFTSVPGLGWKVVVGVPIDAALAPLRSDVLRTALVTAGMLLLLALLTFRLVTRIEAPVRGLARATEGVIAGRFDEHVPVEGPSEIAAVAERFNEMLDVRHRAEEERARAEAAHAESERRLRLAVDASHIGLWDWQLPSGRIYFSPEWKRQLGYAEDELPNEFEEWRRRIHPDDLPQALARLEAYIAHPVGDYQSELRLQHRDGSWRWIWARARLLRDADGRSTRMIGCHIDVTDRRRGEEEQARLQRELRQSAVLSAMGTLVAGVAHEVRNPLFGMSATLDAFEARFGRQPGHERYLGVLRQELANVNRLMKDLLDYGRPASPNSEAIDLERVTQDAVTASLPLAAGCRVRIETQAVTDLPQPWADAAMMRQVLVNLIENAVQHSPPDGVVAVKLGRGRNGTASIEVLDSGAGFRSEDLPRVFDPFFSRRQGGTGLGLSIVRRLVESFGGEIVADNQLLGGARVTVRLPVRERATV